jgi:hypothetical protein
MHAWPPPNGKPRQNPDQIRRSRNPEAKHPPRGARPRSPDRRASKPTFPSDPLPHGGDRRDGMETLGFSSLARLEIEASQRPLRGRGRAREKEGEGEEAVGRVGGLTFGGGWCRRSARRRGGFCAASPRLCSCAPSLQASNRTRSGGGGQLDWCGVEYSKCFCFFCCFSFSFYFKFVLYCCVHP